MKSEARARASREAHGRSLREVMESASISVELRDRLRGLEERMLLGGVTVDQVIAAVEALPLASPEAVSAAWREIRRLTAYCTRCGDDALPNWSPPVCRSCSARDFD